MTSEVTIYADKDIFGDETIEIGPTLVDIVELNRLADEIHANNVEVGWWTDIKTGESILRTRSRGEMLALVISEVSEADEGLQNDLNDDKLPHLPMFNVELADVAIRLLDMIGAENSIAGDVLEFDYNDEIFKVWDDQVDHFGFTYNWFPAIVNRCSAALEHERKGRTKGYRTELVKCLCATIAIAHLAKFDLFDIIDQKRNFNANRADHKLENRLKNDGKKF